MERGNYEGDEMKNHDTSVEAFDRIKPQLTELQDKVIRVARSLGSFTDAELSRELPQYAYSTIPKRRGFDRLLQRD